MKILGIHCTSSSLAEKSRDVYKHKLAHSPDTCYNRSVMAGDLRIAHDNSIDKIDLQGADNG